MTTIAFKPADHVKPGPFRANLNAPAQPPLPLKTFFVDRCGYINRKLRRAVERLIRDEKEIFKRSPEDIRAYLDKGELIAVFEQMPCGRRRLVAVSIYQLHIYQSGREILDISMIQEGVPTQEIIEIGLTVINRRRRGWGLSEIAASAVMVHALSIHNHLVAILNTFRLTNAACQAANHRVFADVDTFRGARMRYPNLRPFQQRRNSIYRSGGWIGSAKMALMTEQSYRAAVHAFCEMDARRYRTRAGHVIALGTGWDSPGFRDQLEHMRRGYTPDVETWKVGVPHMHHVA